MTDRTPDIDPAERVRQLQARRAAAGSSRRPSTVARTASGTHQPGAATRAATGPQSTRQRRRHPAAATRWLLGGLSIASFFGIAGTVALANVNSVAAPTPTNIASSAPATSNTPASATPVTSKSTSTAGATSTARVAHTTTHGS
ncbi:MAG: hypothetical protein ACXV8R_05190 [Acidimicrobiia bacterium]